MKKQIALLLTAALMAALLVGCAGTNYGYGYTTGYDGNVSSTDNGYVNGRNYTGTGSAYNGTETYAGTRGTHNTNRSTGTTESTTGRPEARSKVTPAQ